MTDESNESEWSTLVSWQDVSYTKTRLQTRPLEDRRGWLVRYQMREPLSDWDTGLVTESAVSPKVSDISETHNEIEMGNITDQ